MTAMYVAGENSSISITSKGKRSAYFEALLLSVSATATRLHIAVAIESAVKVLPLPVGPIDRHAPFQRLLGCFDELQGHLFSFVSV